jgi:diacylglycerol kinase family enzyme
MRKTEQPVSTGLLYMELGIILNPKSRANLKNPSRIKYYRNISNEILEVRATESFEDLTRTAREFKRRRVPYIGISGGDGTIHQVITACINAYAPSAIPPVLLLGDGTMNNIFSSVGIKGHGVSVLSRFVHAVKSNKFGIQERLTMKIDDRYCFLFGCGLTTNFLHAAYDGKKGNLKNIQVILKCIREVISTGFGKDSDSLVLMRPLIAKMYTSGIPISLEKLLVVLAGTVEKVGMGFRPMSKALHRKGYFHLLATDIKPMQLLGNLRKIGTGKGYRIKNDRFIDIITDEIEIISKNPFEYTMDGDMYQCDGRLKMVSGPSVRFLVV